MRPYRAQQALHAALLVLAGEADVAALRDDRDKLFEDLSRAELEIAELRNEVATTAGGPMTQRLTPEREAEIRLAVKRQQLFGGHSEDLLAEIEALRAELAGAEERGRQRPWTPELASDMAALYEYMLDKSPRVDKFRVMFEVGQRLLVRTGTAAADAGEPGNG